MSRGTWPFRGDALMPTPPGPLKLALLPSMTVAATAVAIYWYDRRDIAT